MGYLSVKFAHSEFNLVKLNLDSIEINHEFIEGIKQVCWNRSGLDSLDIESFGTRRSLKNKLCAVLVV